MSMRVHCNNEQRYQNPGYLKTAGAIMAGGMASSLVKSAAVPISNMCLNKMIATNNEMKNSFKNVFIPAAEKMWEQSGLKDAGVKIIDAGTKEYYETNVKPMEEIFDKIKLPKSIQKLIIPAKSAHEGKNAFFMPKRNLPDFIKKYMPDIPSTGNEVHVAKDKFALSTFHELGHAINCNLSKTGKILQKMRLPAMAIAGLIGAIALFKAPKAEGEKPKGSFDKTTTFIKNNAGKLAFAAMLPIVAEEGLASLHAAKWAKKLLSSDMAKQVNKTNALGFATYAVAAIVTGLSAWAASAVRDKLAHKEPIPQYAYRLNKNLTCHQG